MKLGKRNKRNSMIALFLMLFIGSSLVLPIALAHDPAWVNTTYCYVAPSPPTVGVGQAVELVWWLNALMPTSSGDYGDRWIAYIDVIKPNGENDTLGPLTSDPVGGGFTWYTPDQVGTYTIVARFPGQTLTGGRTPDGLPSTSVYVGDIYLPSTSKPAYLTVQEEAIPKYQETPLPTDYWTRPIYDTNRGWGNAVMGQWLGGSYYESLRSRGIPYTSGPESSHILWTRSYWSGGILGGHNDVAYYNGIAYEGFSSPLVVIEGKAYYSVQNPPRYGWFCIDAYTGETIYYDNDTSIPTMGQVLRIQNPNEGGGHPYLWRTSGVTLPAGSTSQSGTQSWEFLDAFSGHSIAYIANVSASGTQFRDDIGSICYVNFVNLGTSSAPNYYMQVWNTTEAIHWRPQFGAYPPKTNLDGTHSTATSTQNVYWQWRPARLAVYDGRYGFSMNISVPSIYGPRNSVLNETGSIREVVPDECIIVGTGGRNDARGNVDGYLRAYSLKNGEWGNVLWETKFTAPKASDDYPNATYSGGVSFGGVSNKDGVFWYTERVTGKAWVYDIESGKQMWTFELSSPWAYYGTSLTVHNGKVYTIGAAGLLDCLDVKTGEKLWNFTAPSVGYLENEGLTYSPVGLAFFIDDPLTGKEKLYLHGSTGWAGQTSPIRRDGSVFCIDTSSGELLWRLTAYPNYANNALSKVIVSEGHIMYLDNHDNQIYCLGKGPSATTVTASPKALTNGASVMIEGTVTDQSPSGRHNVNGDLDFTLKGTPAISDESMDAWMEYMFHQRPKPTNATGVTVSLDTLDPNGNYYHIGNVTSDSNGNYGFPFTPEVPGTYQIIATFGGSASYGPSSATTYISVGEAVATASPYPEVALPPTEMYVVGAAIVIVIAIAIVGAVLALMIRKRP